MIMGPKYLRDLCWRRLLPGYQNFKNCSDLIRSSGLGSADDYELRCAAERAREGHGRGRKDPVDRRAETPWVVREGPRRRVDDRIQERRSRDVHHAESPRRIQKSSVPTMSCPLRPAPQALMRRNTDQMPLLSLSKSSLTGSLTLWHSSSKRIACMPSNSRTWMTKQSQHLSTTYGDYQRYRLTKCCRGRQSMDFYHFWHSARLVDISLPLFQSESILLPRTRLVINEGD